MRPPRKTNWTQATIGQHRAIRSVAVAALGSFSGCNALIGLELGEPPSMEEAICSDIGECDAGAPCTGDECPSCDTPAQCPGTDDFCTARTCVDHHCGFSYESAGTPVPTEQQAAGDCKHLQCDGNGGIRALADDGDPSDDSNDCTSDTCTNSAPKHDPMPGMVCAQGQGSCDSGGQCKLVNGEECSADNECESTFCTDNKCCNTPCEGTCLGCNIQGYPGVCSQLSPLTDDNNAYEPCNGDHTCAASGACKLKPGEQCMMSPQCASENCEGIGICS